MTDTDSIVDFLKAEGLDSSLGALMLSTLSEDRRPSRRNS
jgi:hypothetical protein